MKFPWKSNESELERELAHHLYHLTAEYERRGYSRKDAESLAKREFGGYELTKDQCRDEAGCAWLNGLQQDIVFGWRMLRRTPVVTFAAIVSLALAIGANTAIVSLMDLVLWRDLPVPAPRQLTTINWQAHSVPREMVDGASGSSSREDGLMVADFFSYPAYQTMRQKLAGKASIAAFSYPDTVSVSFAGNATVAKQRPVSGNFLSTLEVRPFLGRLLAESDDRVAAAPVVILSHRFWAQQLGARSDMVGRMIVIDDKPAVVAGVLQSQFYGLMPGDATDIYAPLARLVNPRPSN